MLVRGRLESEDRALDLDQSIVIADRVFVPNAEILPVPVPGKDPGKGIAQRRTRFRRLRPAGGQIVIEVYQLGPPALYSFSTVTRALLAEEMSRLSTNATRVATSPVASFTTSMLSRLR